MVMDPYTGSGTTGVAAIVNDRDFMGCELDPDYHAAALRRIKSSAIGRKEAV